MIVLLILFYNSIAEAYLRVEHTVSDQWDTCFVFAHFSTENIVEQNKTG